MHPAALPVSIRRQEGCSGIGTGVIVGMREGDFCRTCVPHKQDRCQNRDKVREHLPDPRRPDVDCQPFHGIKTTNRTALFQHRRHSYIPCAQVGSRPRAPRAIQTAIAIIIRFSVSDTKPRGTLLAPPTQAHLSSRRSR